MMLSISDGRKLIAIARHSILSSLDSKNSVEFNHKDVKKFLDKRGVFVTLNYHGELRGCIGFIEAIYPLYEGIAKAANLAAFNDPRFPPVSELEFKDVKVEISILTPAKEIKANSYDGYTKQIKIGRDGLIIDDGDNHGLLLPQVPEEWNWDVKEFLEHTCMKAGIDKNAWKGDDCKVSKFSAQIFSEEGNKVVEKTKN